MIKPEPAIAQPSAADKRTVQALAIELRYRRSQVFGLLLIAAIILAATLYRADPHTLFPPGWWRWR